MRQFMMGEEVTCNNAKPLTGNSIAPPLTEGQKYLIKDIVLDREKNQHLDVGLSSEYNYITSYDTKEELPHGDTVHWCHPSRFE